MDELLNKHKDDGSFQSKHVHKKTLAEEIEEEIIYEIKDRYDH